MNYLQNKSACFESLSNGNGSYARFDSQIVYTEPAQNNIIIASISMELCLRTDFFHFRKKFFRIEFFLGA